MISGLSNTSPSRANQRQILICTSNSDALPLRMRMRKRVVHSHERGSLVYSRGFLRLFTGVNSAPHCTARIGQIEIEREGVMYNKNPALGDPEPVRTGLNRKRKRPSPMQIPAVESGSAKDDRKLREQGGHLTQIPLKRQRVAPLINGEAKMPQQKEPKTDRPPPPKRPVGRPPELVVKIDDTPENVARAAFGKRRKREQRRRDEEESTSR